MATLTRFAEGLPRLVSRLAHLALAAAAGDGLAGVDASTVERVWRELAPADPVAVAAASPTFHQGSASGISRPRVRAVRRLFQDG